MRDPRPPTRLRGYDPAPVISDEGTWGTPPPPYRGRAAERGSEARAWLTLLLAVVMVLWLTAFSLAQATSRSVAVPAAQRALATLAEVDSLLVLHEEDLCAAAGENTTVELPGFPVHDVTLLGTEVHCPDGRLDYGATRNALLQQGSELTYLRGAEALTDPGRSPSGLSPFSGVGLVRLVFDTLTTGIHEQATLAAWALGGLSAVLALAVVMLGRRGRLNRLAAALLLAAVPVIIGAVALRLLVGLMQPETGVLADVIDIIRELAWLPLRNGLIVGAAGLALTVPALLRRRRDHDPDDDVIEYRPAELTTHGR